MGKGERIIQVPKNYYRCAHETRYRNIFGAGAVFRGQDMNSHVTDAWRRFRSSADLACGVHGIEFGCGTGINAVIMAQEGFRMTGLDICPTAIQKAVELAERNGYRAEFIVGDMFETGLRSASFDFAANIWALHAVGEQELRERHLSECYRILRPGGYLFLHNESAEKDVLRSDERTKIEEVDVWNIQEHSQLFDLPDGSKIEISFPGHMPPGLSGRRSLREHQGELRRSGFVLVEAYEEVMRPNPSVPGNRVMIGFAQKPERQVGGFRSIRCR